ncbi:MAG: hypothetical protein V3U75_13475 [Methylococcaceae bacterium]
MASFEDVPEDSEESHPCPNCDTGEVTADGLLWACDSCGWVSP